MARFVITDPAGGTQIFEISTPTVSIGRVESNDLVLRHGSVSRHHVRLSMLPGDIALLNDLGSLNGTFVNGEQIQEHRLTDQDRIGVGMYELRYESAQTHDLHVEIAGGALTDVNGLVGAEDLSSVLRLASPPAISVPAALPDRVQLLEKENNRLKLLLTVGNALSSLMTPEDVMRQLMEVVFQMENVERGFVMLQDEKKVFKPAVLLYKDESLKAAARGLALSSTVINRVVSDHEPLLIHDVGSDERFSSSQSLRISGIRSAMCAPLIYKDRVFGLFYVDCLSKPYAFSKEELDIFSVIAAGAAISFDRARAHEDLARREVERRALERFLDRAIVEKVLAHPDEIHLGGENQEATVLFADIRNFTRMSEHMEPQAVVELLNIFFSEMTDIIFDSGGTLDKYMGDGIMAVYGPPFPKHDDAFRAAKTAIEMQRALAHLNRRWEGRGQPPLRMGVGVNTGKVTAGNIGSDRRMDYTVIGDTVNVASRLCANAAGEQVLISESTFAQLAGSFSAERLEPILVKGKEAPVELYSLLWEEAGEGPALHPEQFPPAPGCS